ncbi:MAG: hypothetical protein JXB49_16925 [Bacteroidales bacterium]|nr:hypothetical protein [Bacteroidales bacterium]
MKNFKVFLLILICLTFVFITKQIKGQAPSAGLAPNVVWPTPEASSIFKYIEYPVNHSTGCPSINIPIYEVKCGDLSVPISISYHASGRKVYDETGAIGLGWTFNAGGMISRTINGTPDDYDNKFKFPDPWRSVTEGLNEYEDYYFLAGVDKRESFLSNPYITDYQLYDTQYDIFSYMFNSNSGKFVFEDSSGLKIPVLLPESPIIIEKHSNTSAAVHYFDYLNIVDDKGTFYRFGKSIINGTEYIEVSGNYKSSWLLTEIISPDKSDTISFKYTSFVKIKGVFNQEYALRTTLHLDQTPSSSEYIYIHDGIQDNYTQIQRLTEIKFKQGKIIINLENGTDKISSLQVYNLKNTEPIKTVEFHRSLLDKTNIIQRIETNYKLDEVIFKDLSMNEIEKYSLKYYPTVEYISAMNQDLWGYHNNQQNNSLVPFIATYQGNFQANENSNRTSNFAGQLCGVLSKIIYPTGGSTQFTYEINKYKDHLGVIRNSGGLRIKMTETDDINGNVIVKRYTYGTNECGYGIPLFTPSIENMTYTVSYYYLDSPGSLGSGYCDKVGSCNILPQYGYYLQNPLHYPEVTEYTGTINANIGKTVYEFNLPNNASIGRFGPNVDYNYWDYTTTKSVTTFKSNSSSNSTQYDTLKHVSNYYQKKSTKRLKGLLLNRTSIFTPENIYSADSPAQNDFIYKKGESWEQAWLHNKGGSIYTFFDYTISIGKTQLIQTIENDYADIGNISKTTYFTYDPKYGLLKDRHVHGGSINTEIHYKYPFDYPSSSLYNEMISSNMLNYTIETNTYNNSLFSQGTKISYRKWTNTLIAPDSIFIRNGNAPYEPKIVYDNYDENGNIIQYHNPNDKKISFIWGYKNTYPVAKIENATLDEIKGVFGGNIPNLGISGLTKVQENALRMSLPKAHVTSYGYNPLIGISTVTDPNGISSYYNYDDYGRLMNIKDDDLNILKSYSYSLADLAFANIEKSQSFTKNDCNSDELGSSVVYTVPAGTYFSSVSQSAANAKADADIAANGQNFANETGYCFVYYNDAQSAVYTKNNCQAGYLGSEVTYTVPARTYTSIISQDDANMKAQNDIIANGQTYANTWGTCRPDITYYNVATSGTFTKNNCEFGYEGSQVIYTVPANQYTSTISQEDANNKAQADVNNNGQAYANQKGTCSLLPVSYLTVSGAIGFQKQVTLVIGGQSKNFTIPSGGNGTIAIPKSTYYRLIISLLGCSGETYTFTIQNGASKTGICSASFQNVSVQSDIFISIEE